MPVFMTHIRILKSEVKVDDDILPNELDKTLSLSKLSNMKVKMYAPLGHQYG